MVKNTVEQIYGSIEGHPNSSNEKLERDLKTLRETYLRIERKIEKQLKQKWYNQALERDAMSRILDKCTREFDNAQQVFLVNSAIDLRQQVVAIVARIDGRRLQVLKCSSIRRLAGTYNLPFLHIGNDIRPTSPRTQYPARG
ncbi:hypothetical protein WOLCODRAFT_17821 [Wolfiporia cocos MD-104 SS10]|uniref:Uncharacterized protein n=1 Tax=Wolfiporia cocos (strain MD-104) TaxID=742152 RepID=A0A2H3K2E8_WOLCO|nr:hypothetical protein WOLCODRAFT_17821 [Wolfiporia cocos MD-104 SS10]